MKGVKEAQKLGLTGWAKNLADGRVEIVACGTQASIESFESWLSKGPILANVENIETAEIEKQQYTDFQTL